MNPFFAFLKQQKPEWEGYLNVLEQWQQLQESADVNSTEDQSDEDEALVRPNIIAAPETDKFSTEQLLAEITELEEELQEEITLNTKLAKALGACGDCFGENLECLTCKGKGKPGYFVPNFSLFRRYVLPAIKAYNTQFN